MRILLPLSGPATLHSNMGKPTLVPVTPSVLEWALQESGYSPDTVAQKVGVPRERLQAWLRGSGQPKLTEFRKLATLLKRTPATFLLPEPPEQAPPAVEFRRPPGTERAALNPLERRYLREAQRLQELLVWVQDELGEPAASPLPHVHHTQRDPEDAAAVWVSQLNGRRPNATRRTSSQLFQAWRDVLEGLGVLVFSFSLGRDGVRGFSIWDDRVPVIALNTGWRIEARLYTLFHEFGHLLTRTASACLEAGRRFAPASDSVERWCEQYSAAVLLPRDDVQKFLTHELHRPLTLKVDDLDVPSRVATRFRVSLRAATLRLIEMKLANWDLYAKIPPASENKPPGGGGSGRDRGEIREDQFGDRAVHTFVNALKHDVLGRTDVLDALDITDTDLTKFERKAARTA